jgi:hypothetical protein
MCGIDVPFSLRGLIKFWSLIESSHEALLAFISIFL